MKVAVLGNTGMLGHVVQNILRKNINLEVEGYGRESIDLIPRPLNHIGTKLSQLLGFHTDYVINCIGATKPIFDNTADLGEPIYVNAVFPHQLSQWGHLSNTKVIHVTTDCVYDGHLGRYDERAPSSAQDHYGKSKSLGEPNDCMVIRTSIIGPEFGDRSRHFLSWVKSMSGQSVKGFTNHYWNGVTTIELGRIISDIINRNLYSEGTQHIHSTDVSKFDMVKVISDIYELELDITPYETEHQCDRRMRTVETLNWEVQPKPYEDMIKDMLNYERNNISSSI